MTWEKYTLRPVQNSAPVAIPVFIYGTAWKKDRTADLVYQALSAGFRAVDTAAQPKHYREDLVGDGIRRAIKDGTVRREDLHIQTKFTSVEGQDPENMPYDPAMSITEQVHTSVRSSLCNLRPHNGLESAGDSYIDTLILHSPLATKQQTMEAWTALESYVPHRVRSLGISNCSLPLFEDLLSQATIKPSVVQNRFYPSTRFDVPLRALCRDRDIIYQSFWTLTANPDLLHSDAVRHLAAGADISSAAALYCLVMSLGNTALLNGTSSRGTMAADLAAPSKVEQFTREQSNLWQKLTRMFQRSVGDRAS